MKKNFFCMARLAAALLMLLPLAGISQVKNVISTHRVFPKMDKKLEFEKAIATHAQKYHTGNTQWRVFEIQSGPDMGGYHVTEGPTSWEAEDTRGNLGEEHNIDWNKNVAIYLTEKQSGGYSVYVDSLSTVALGDFSDKIQITHVYPKLGWTGKLVSMIKKLKAAWIAEGSTIAVYQVNASGPAQYALTNRLKQGLKEKASGFRKPFRETFDAVNGAGAYEEYLEDLRQYVNETWTELLFLRKDLSSK